MGCTWSNIWLGFIESKPIVTCILLIWYWNSVLFLCQLCGWSPHQQHTHVFVRGSFVFHPLGILFVYIVSQKFTLPYGWLANNMIQLYCFEFYEKEIDIKFKVINTLNYYYYYYRRNPLIKSFKIVTCGVYPYFLVSEPVLSKIEPVL